MTNMRSWKSHRLTHIHGWALIHNLGDLSQGCHWFIFLRSPQRFHCHFHSLYEHLNLWSKLALIFFYNFSLTLMRLHVGKHFFTEKNQSQLRLKIQMFL
jgi:hypothetical protein